jgi:hypothetical protein
MSYRPEIDAEQLRNLWLLKQHTGIPITELVRDAVDEYLGKFQQEIDLTEQHLRERGVLR